MSLLHHFIAGVRALIQRSRVDQEISEEVKHYFEEATQARMERGFTREEANRAVRLEFGSHVSVQEQVRSYGWQNVIQNFFADLRYAFRQLRAFPVFSAVSVFTIAIGVGTTTAILAAVYAILVQPLPYTDADRIVAILEINHGSRNEGSFGMYRGLVERTHGFESIAVLKTWRPVLAGLAQPERLDGQRVSASYFDVLQVRPFLGRHFTAAEDVINGPEVVVLSYAFWQRRFNGDESIIGKSILLDEKSAVVIGVMPADFENTTATAAQIWAPMQYGMAQGRAWGHHLRTIGRLRAGITIDQATEEVELNGQAVLREQHPETYGTNVRLVARPLQKEITQSVRPALLAILAAALIVLLIACVNVTNLLLARGVHRRGEFALRAALGAGRGRLMRQLFTESLVLAVLGGTCGMFVAWAGTHALVTLSPPNLPRLHAIQLDTTVFWFALGMTMLLGIAFGFLPARHASRMNFQVTMQPSSRGGAGKLHTRARNSLVIGEVALSLVLLVSSGLLWRSRERLFDVDVGFDPLQMTTVQVQATGERFKDDATVDQFFDQILQAIQRVSGVKAAAYTSQLPLSDDLDEYGVHFEAGASQPAQSYSAFRYAVSPRYIETMRIRMLRGRSFRETDREGAIRVAIISETLAKLRFGNADPIGKLLRIGPMDGAPYTIIGVVADVKQLSLAVPQSSAVYIPARQWPFPDLTISIVIRSGRDKPGDALVPAVDISSIRHAVWSVDKNQPIVRVATMEELVAATAAERSFALILFEAFGLVALILAAAGIYGLLAGRVAESIREIGVRSALGASRRAIVLMVLRQGIRLAGFGIAIGFIAAVIVTQAIVAMLFQITPLDPLTHIGVVLLLTLVTIVASAVPAWRASRIDPSTTLRAE